MRNLSVAAMITLVAAGCVEDPQPTDRDQIVDLLRHSSLVAPVALDGRGEDGASREVLPPEAWWREITTEGPLDIVLENDPSIGVCTVTVCRSLVAEFNIDVVHDGVLDPSVKAVRDLASRRVIVRKLPGSGGTPPYGGWVLTHVTPAEFSLASGLEQEVFVRSMRIYEDGDLVWECDDPGRFSDVRTELPVLREGALLRVEAEPVHAAPLFEPPLFVFVHGPCPVWPRHLMYDDGTFGDRVAGDGIFTYEWYVEDCTPDGLHVAVDVIDADTMEDEVEEDYDSGAWGIRVLRDGWEG